MRAWSIIDWREHRYSKLRYSSRFSSTRLTILFQIRFLIAEWIYRLCSPINDTSCRDGRDNNEKWEGNSEKSERRNVCRSKLQRIYGSYLLINHNKAKRSNSEQYRDTKINLLMIESRKKKIRRDFSEIRVKNEENDRGNAQKEQEREKLQYILRNTEKVRDRKNMILIITWDCQPFSLHLRTRSPWIRSSTNKNQRYFAQLSQIVLPEYGLHQKTCGMRLLKDHRKSFAFKISQNVPNITDDDEWVIMLMSSVVLTEKDKDFLEIFTGEGKDRFVYRKWVLESKNEIFKSKDLMIQDMTK